LRKKKGTLHSVIHSFAIYFPCYTSIHFLKKIKKAFHKTDNEKPQQ